MKRRARRASGWRTKFGAWVGVYGVGRLARDVGLAVYRQPLRPAAAYRWVWGTRQPRPAVARALVRLSSGALTLEDVYGLRQAGEKGAAE